MPKVTLDMSEAQDFSPVPVGTFQARISDVQLKTSKAGNGYAAVTFELWGNVNAASVVNGRKLWLNAPYSGKGAGIFKGLFEAATRERLASNLLELDTDALLGKDVVVTVKHELDPNGVTVARVASVGQAVTDGAVPL